MDYSQESIDEMMLGQTESVTCPTCGSSHCQLQATARKAGLVIGGVIGAIFAAGLSGAKVGAVHGAVLASKISRRSPATFTGMIGGALIGFTWGAIAGHAAGADIDKNVLRIYQCRACGFEFNT